MKPEKPFYNVGEYVIQAYDNNDDCLIRTRGGANYQESVEMADKINTCEYYSSAKVLRVVYDTMLKPHRPKGIEK